MIIREARPEVITEQAGLKVSVGESRLVITTRSAVAGAEGVDENETDSIEGSGLDSFCSGTDIVE